MTGFRVLAAGVAAVGIVLCSVGSAASNDNVEKLVRSTEPTRPSFTAPRR